jgi:hypothetical protein
MREIDMTAFSKPAKLFSVPLIGMALAVFYTSFSPPPAHACGAPTATQLFCSAAGTAPPGFGSTFQDNLIDPLGGQCSAGGPGCGDTFVDVSVGECTDGSTSCNAGGDLLLPVNNDPCISCFAEPGQVGSLTGNDDQSLQPVRDYLGEQRKILAFQQAAFNRAQSTADNLVEQGTANGNAIRTSQARIEALEAEAARLRKDLLNERYDEEAANRVYDALEAEESKLSGLRATGRELEGAQELADRNVASQAELIGHTGEKIARAEETGNVPESPGGFLTQFGGGGEATQSAYFARGGENSTYNKAVQGGGYTFDLHRTEGGRAVSFMFDGAVGSQFLRSTSGHATNEGQENLSAGTIAGAELWDKPFLITHQYMQAGVERNLLEAVRRGDVPGTIEIVRTDDGSGTKEVVTIPPEGLEAAKPYLDVQDSLFEGMIEEDRNTTSDEERRTEAERREQDTEQSNREFRRQQAEQERQRKANPVPAKDVQDNVDPDGFHSVIDEIQGVIPLA